MRHKLITYLADAEDSKVNALYTPLEKEHEKIFPYVIVMILMIPISFRSFLMLLDTTIAKFQLSQCLH